MLTMRRGVACDFLSLCRRVISDQEIVAHSLYPPTGVRGLAESRCSQVKRDRAVNSSALHEVINASSGGARDDEVDAESILCRGFLSQMPRFYVAVISKSIMDMSFDDDALLSDDALFWRARP